ncbi:MAG TPA: uracil-DNA glycosylase [Thermoanaerobaculia bacterium]|nr:uracil-DNA glycosylase [Thermoanaerobaculia bacterium]
MAEGRADPALAAVLEYFRDLGVRELFVSSALPGTAAGWMADQEALQAYLVDCSRCKLAGSRQRIVFGFGNPNADLMFVGEAPGREEDEQGIPFVGAAGQLLSKIIEAMGMRREDVFIVNTVLCRPPNNRNPEPDEVASCRPFLQEQIRLVAPRVIVTLGTFAAHAILETDEPISRLRGRWRSAHGARVMPTFHPAYLLRSPQHKKDVWGDMQNVRDYLARQPGAR